MLSSLGRLVGRVLGRPTPPTPIGIHAGTGRLTRAGFRSTSVSKRKTLTVKEVDDFVDGNVLFVNSSCVAAMQYFKTDSKMMVEYLDRSVYLYSNVSDAEARSIARARSKGTAIWYFFRVRGSKTMHRKPYICLQPAL